MNDQKRRSVIAVELRRLSSSLPPLIRDGFTSEFVQKVAESLIDGTVFQIVDSLREKQQMTERRLYETRRERQAYLEGQKTELMARNRPVHYYGAGNSYMMANETNEQVTKFDNWSRQELRTMDMHIIRELDQQVAQQQLALENAGVPAFRVTNDPDEIKLQMHIVDFIAKIHNKLPM